MGQKQRARRHRRWLVLLAALASSCGEVREYCAETDSCGCPEGELSCDGRCVSPLEDSNCGGCGVVCSEGSVCIDGGCGCPPCGPDRTCQGDRCVCDDGLTWCSERCVDLTSERSACGSCGNPCGGDEVCEAGRCRDRGGDDCGGLARGVAIRKVSLFQGVEIPLFDDGGFVEPTARRAPVVQGRDAIVRIAVDTEEGWAPRALSARVRLGTAAEARSLFQKKLVRGDSRQADLDTSFVVEIPGAWLDALTTLRVELVECEASPGGSVVGPVALPSQGGLPLDAFETGPIRVAFLPIEHAGLLPDTSQATIDAYVSAIERQYPTTHVEASVLSPIDSGEDGALLLFDDLLERLRAKRLSDRPPADLYYYGLVRPHESYEAHCVDGCDLGMAYVVDFDASFRVALGLAYADQETRDTLVHELGHSHGRQHSPCGTPGDDPRFPYSGGLLGSWGYDLVSRELKAPSAYMDFMGYCAPVWISDYTYGGIAQRINQVQNDKGRAARRVASRPYDTLVVGRRGVKWGAPVPADEVSPEREEPGFVYDERGEILAQVPLHRVPLSEGHGYVLVVPPREAGWAAVGNAEGITLAYP